MSAYTLRVYLVKKDILYMFNNQEALQNARNTYAPGLLSLLEKTSKNVPCILAFELVGTSCRETLINKLTSFYTKCFIFKDANYGVFLEVLARSDRDLKSIEFFSALDNKEQNRFLSILRSIGGNNFLQLKRYEGENGFILSTSDVHPINISAILITLRIITEIVPKDYKFNGGIRALCNRFIETAISAEKGTTIGDQGSINLLYIAAYLLYNNTDGIKFNNYYCGGCNGPVTYSFGYFSEKNWCDIFGQIAKDKVIFYRDMYRKYMFLGDISVNSYFLVNAANKILENKGD